MYEDKGKIKVLFLCTGNSYRSQMAEGWARWLKGDCIEPFSAGVNPCFVNPRAVKVMAEAGVDISNHTSKRISDLAGIEFDYVVTLCDDAKEQCPVFPGKTRLVHKGFKDPACAVGSEEEITGTFRKVRGQIRAFIETLPEGLETNFA